MEFSPTSGVIKNAKTNILSSNNLKYKEKNIKSIKNENNYESNGKGYVNTEENLIVTVTLDDLPNNTYVDNHGILRCINTYIGDNPVSWRGCWSCDQCEENFFCDFPGKCRCKDGYTESENGECHHPIPFIFGLDILSGNFFPGDSIAIGYGGVSYQYKPKNAFCKLDQIILECKLLEEYNISCEIPLHIKAKQISISFDAIHWSPPIIFAKEINQSHQRSTLGFLPTAVCITLLMLVIIKLIQHFGEKIHIIKPKILM